MKVLGIDPGSRACGYGLVDFTSGVLVALDFGVWREGDGRLSRRLESLFARAERFLADCRPDAVALETVFAGKSAASAVALSHARGVVLLAAARAGLPTYEYEPLTIKKSITGYGRAEKPQVREMVKSLLSATSAAIPLDAADALATAICHCHHASGPTFDGRTVAC
ncbi:MAG TPA: crossover junction endodeoxyribonuclease RuvC [Thermoanaerobaculia bacterium]|nr:crossover junction endodeoxyribonuclease RuvC [Thermoanaerobaculia bacterium]